MGNIIISTNFDLEKNPTKAKGIRKEYENKNREKSQESETEDEELTKPIAAFRFAGLLGPNSFGAKTIEKTTVAVTRTAAKNMSK